MFAAADRTSHDDDASFEAIVDALHEADRLHARAARMLGTLAGSGTIEAATGLPVEMALRAFARRAGWDARELTSIADTLRAMPHTSAAVAEGLVSWSQLRAITRTIRVLDQAARVHVDALIGARARELAAADPETLIELVDDDVARLRQDLIVAREDRAIETSFLRLQPCLGGGGSLYAEADPERFATITRALDTHADRPQADDETSVRARQHLDALVAICEQSMSGAKSRARPRLLATIDIHTDDTHEAAQILGNTIGRPVRLSDIATDMLLCDADITPIPTNDGQPIAVGKTISTVPPTIRTTIIARDQRCRFPGCDMPAAWADVHHIEPRSHGGTHEPTNLMLLCRRCHRRVHRHPWKITPQPDGTIRFRYRGRTLTSHPRARAPARE